MLKSLRSTLRRDWTLLVFELAIVVLGISISFGLQDWRQGRKDAAEEQRLLGSFAAEIQQDREVLVQSTERLEQSLEALRGALHSEKRKELGAEDLDQVMDMALGYINFTPSVATYFELRQTGGSGLIRDKDVLRRLITLYERFYPQALEWDDINRNYVLETMFPFVDQNGPSFDTQGEGAFAHGYHAAFEALEQDPKFRNLLRSNIMFKEGQRVVYTQLNEVTDMVLKDLEKYE